ncbi:MAG: hypothetical protein ACRC4M_05925, partial [Mycoplasma sp.]
MYYKETPKELCITIIIGLTVISFGLGTIAMNIIGWIENITGHFNIDIHGNGIMLAISSFILLAVGGLWVGRLGNEWTDILSGCIFIAIGIFWIVLGSFSLNGIEIIKGIVGP